MSVNYSPFESKTGFKSPGFTVSPTGQLDVANLSVAGVPFGGTGTDLILDGDLTVTTGTITLTNKPSTVGTINNINIGTVTPGTGTFTNITANNIITAIDLGVPRFESNTNLEINAKNAVVFQINSTEVGRITSSGLEVAIANTTIENTIIGNTTPAEASFTEVTITQEATSPSNAVRKDYVDRTAIAFSVAFGV